MSQVETQVTNDRLYAEFNSVVADTERLIKSIAAAGGDQTGALRENVERHLAAAGERLAKIRERTLEQAGAAARATDKYVHEHPWQAVGYVAGLAAITGLVAGLLLARR
jgi:ElaB/YqjD/DUF883 family membrane-anchored ribosome-binding protein